MNTQDKASHDCPESDNISLVDELARIQAALFNTPADAFVERLPFAPRTLYLPKGTKLHGPNGKLLATIKNDLWSKTIISKDDFDFADGKPLSGGEKIPDEFMWSTHAARVKQGIQNQNGIDELAAYKKHCGFHNPLDI
jgi:hypothetical protein